MARASTLEEILQAQVEETVKDSSGHFTMAREKALEKLAAFQLGSLQTWILKVVQAVVACGASKLDIFLTSTDAEFLFHLDSPTWTIEQIEDAFYDPETSADCGLDHLKRGLWNVSLQNMRPFFIMLHGWSQALFWNGKDLRRQAAIVKKGNYLAVSHRNLVEGKGFPLLRNIEAATKNSAMAKELSTQAFTCPIPLTLDGRRLDALQACPEHGCGKESYPVYLGALSGNVPDIAIPPATFGKYSPSEPGNKDLARAFHNQVSLPEQVGVICLLTAHVREVSKRRSVVWETYKSRSVLFWVQDGVIIARDVLPVANYCVSCALFASADGLRTDLSGFTLIKDDNYWRRFQEVFKIPQPFLQQTEISLTDFVSGKRRNDFVAGGLLLLGAGLAFFLVPIPFHAIFLGGGGIYTLLRAGKDGEEIEKQLRTGLADLCRDIGKARIVSSGQGCVQDS